MAQGSIVSASVGRIAGNITTSDTVPNVWSYVYVGGAGNVKITTENGDVVTYNSVPGGSFLWVRTSLIWATGTTATNMVGHRSCLSGCVQASPKRMFTRVQCIYYGVQETISFGALEIRYNGVTNFKWLILM